MMIPKARTQRPRSSQLLAALAIAVSATVAAPSALGQASAGSPCAPKRKKIQEQEDKTASPCAPRKKREQASGQDAAAAPCAPKKKPQ